MISAALQSGRDYVSARLDAGFSWVGADRRATYGVSLVRIAFGIGALVFLVVNLQNRDYLWGNASQWMTLRDNNGGFGAPFTFFAGGSAPVELTVKYLALFVVVVIFTIGWRTRWFAPLLLVLWTSLLEANPLTGDQSDNIFRMLLFVFCFADLSGRWSFDARRRARTVARYGAPQPLGRFASPSVNATVTQIGTLFHNFAVVTAGVHICMIYVASGLYKAQGDRWQDGTAVAFPLQLPQYSPWPALNSLLISNTFMVVVVSYFSVFIQLFFPLMLLRRTTRVIAILGIMAMHLGIGIIMGLPFFSLFMMAGDSIFVRDSTFVAIQDRIRGLWGGRSRQRANAVRRAPEAPVLAAASGTEAQQSQSESQELSQQR